MPSYPFENPQETCPKEAICWNPQRGHKNNSFLKADMAEEIGKWTPEQFALTKGTTH